MAASTYDVSYLEDVLGEHFLSDGGETRLDPELAGERSERPVDGLWLAGPTAGVESQIAIAWTTGSLTGTDWERVRMALPWTIVAMGLALISSRQLNVLLLGEQTASSLGMSVEKVRFALSGVAVLAAAASIAVAGIVGFVGLIVPHMIRNIVGSDCKKLVIGCVFAGPALMVAADVGARLALNLRPDSRGHRHGAGRRAVLPLPDAQAGRNG